MTIPLHLITKKDFAAWGKKQPSDISAWLKATGCTGTKPGFSLLPGKGGSIAGALFITEQLSMWSLAEAAEHLPPGQYHLSEMPKAGAADGLMLGWLLSTYSFARYKKTAKEFPVIAFPAGSDEARVRIMADAIHMARDLINTPANDMGPAELAAACKETAKNYGAEYSVIVGSDLLKQNYPAIYEVGKASTREPRLIDLKWGNGRHPTITLVGKGVCFDSGGLDIKPSSGMRMMKKDMGGAACVLALARIIMALKLKVRLRVLIPAVENSIAGNAYRPLDVIKTREGLSVEVGNTDAEGRLILGDALAEADSEKPDLLIDCATLTGAARTALGTDIPALFTPDAELARDLLAHAAAQDDPLWQLPLWPGYRDVLKSTVADINSAPDTAYGGAITAALYLREFVSQTKRWAHIDMMAWNIKHRPGRPVGGEAMAVRTLLALVETIADKK